MQSPDLDLLIREHARDIDAAAPHARFDDLVGPRLSRERRTVRLPAVATRGPMVALAVAAVVLLVVGGGWLVIGFPDTGRAPIESPTPPPVVTDAVIPSPEPAEPQPTSAPETAPSSVPSSPVTMTPGPAAPMDPGDPTVALPLEWTRYDVDGLLRAGTAGPDGIATSGFGSFVDDFDLTMTGAFLRWSPDGSSWAEVMAPGFESPLFDSMLYAGGRYLAYGGSTPPYRSADGVTWEIAAHMDEVWENGEHQWRDDPGNVMGWVQEIAYGDGRYVAAGLVIEFPADPDVTEWDTVEYPAAWVSTDARTWTRSQDRWEGGGSGVPGEVYVHDVIFDGERFLASGSRSEPQPYDSITGEITPYQLVLWESADGLSWSLIESAAGCGGSLAHGDAGYVAVVDDGFCHSPDGVTWTWFDQYVGDDVAYGGGVYVAVGWNWAWNAEGTRAGSGVPVFHYSVDGVNWTEVTGSPELFGRTDSCGNDFAIQAFSVSYADRRFVVFGIDNGPMPGLRDDGPWPCPGAEGSSYVWVGEPPR